MVNAQWGTKKKKKITSTDVKTWHQVFVEKIGIVINNKQRKKRENIVTNDVFRAVKMGQTRRANPITR